MPLDSKKFDWFKSQIKEDVEEHKSKMLEMYKPEQTINMFEGRIGEEGNYGEVWENYLFIAESTIIPTLYYQVPRTIVRPTVSYLTYSAALLDSLVKHYFNDDVKEENQLCIIDAFMPYGYGVMKVGYNSRFGYVKRPSVLTGKTQPGDTQGMEENCEYIRFEKPVLTRVSPKECYLDYSKPFNKGKHVTFFHKRTLKELEESNLYQLSANFINYFKSKDTDNSKIKFNLYEHFREETDGVYKLVYVNEWEEEPIFYAKTKYRELPYALLRFSKTPDQLYSAPHGFHASRAQKELQYLNELQKSHIDRIKRQHLVWTEAITEAGLKVLKSNIVDGVVECTKPLTAGTYQQISSNPMPADLYANVENTRNYLKLLLTVSGGKAGESDVDFAETEKANAAGDMMRTSGMQDAIRDFNKKQIRMTVANVIDFGNPEIVLKITGKDVADPVTGEVLTGKELRFGGENGLVLQDEIQGDTDKDFLYEVDITSAGKKDFPVIRKQLNEYIALVTNPVIEQKLLQEGKKVMVSELVKDYANNFETISNPEKYISDLTPEDNARMAQQQQDAMAMELVSKGKLPMGEPNNEAIEQGAKRVTV